MPARSLLAWFALLLACAPPHALAKEPLPVRAVALESVLIRPESSAPASVVSLGDSRLSAEVSAPVAEIGVRVGDVVETGDVLARLECGDHALAVDELSARLEAQRARIGFARQQLERARSLKAQRTLSQESVDERQATLLELVAQRNADEARLMLARRNVERCSITSPFRATVLERLASVGEYAQVGTPLLRVLDLTQLEVTAQVPANEAAQLDASATPVFRQGGRDHALTLRTLTPAIDPIARTREARLQFTGAQALPGAAGRLVWLAPPALPPDLLVRRGNALGVMWLDGNIARFHALEGAREGRPATSDLPAGTLIITDGRQAAEDGDAAQRAD